MSATLTNGKTRSVSSGWKPHFLSYDATELRVLTFATKKDLFAAIDLLWTPKFRGMPFDLAAGRCLIVPTGAVALFEDSGLPFTINLLRTKTELNAAERREYSKRGGF